MSTISTFVLKREDDVTSAAKIGRDFFLGGTVNAPLDNVNRRLFPLLRQSNPYGGCQDFQDQFVRIQKRG